MLTTNDETPGFSSKCSIITAPLITELTKGHCFSKIEQRCLSENFVNDSAFTFVRYSQFVRLLISMPAFSIISQVEYVPGLI